MIRTPMARLLWLVRIGFFFFFFFLWEVCYTAYVIIVYLIDKKKQMFKQN